GHLLRQRATAARPGVTRRRPESSNESALLGGFAGRHVRRGVRLAEGLEDLAAAVRALALERAVAVPTLPGTLALAVDVATFDRPLSVVVELGPETCRVPGRVRTLVLRVAVLPALDPRTLRPSVRIRRFEEARAVL